VGLGRHAGLQGEFDGSDRDLLIMLEDQGQDLHHLAVTARPLEQMLLQGSERRRHLGEGRAVAQGAGLALEQALHERRPVHCGGLVHHSDRASPRQVSSPLSAASVTAVTTPWPRR